ncbi:MAG: nitroreductase [Rhodobacteraceae bacterium]|nr:nitroreductase [Paracoccaceae bacterium]
MPAPNPDALDFLLTRRSRPAKTLIGPAPDRAALEPILTAALRSPDHGKLEPWRLIVLERPALQRLSEAVTDLGADQERPAEAVAKMAAQFAMAELAVAVVAAPVPSPKVPEVEQLHSAGAVCLSLLNAALAAGWGANWLTGWAAHERGFVEPHLGLAAQETIAGFIHIGTETNAPPERPRPDPAAKVSWVSQ